jgi:hypothetical protein
MTSVEDISVETTGFIIDDVQLSKKFRDDDDVNNDVDDIFGAIDILPAGDLLYHPQVELFRTEQSRLVRCLSVSPQCQQIDDKSVPRTLRPSKSADLNNRMHLDTNDESRVSNEYKNVPATNPTIF